MKRKAEIRILAVFVITCAALAAVGLAYAAGARGVVFTAITLAAVVIMTTGAGVLQ